MSADAVAAAGRPDTSLWRLASRRSVRTEGGGQLRVSVYTRRDAPTQCKIHLEIWDPSEDDAGELKLLPFGITADVDLQPQVDDGVRAIIERSLTYWRQRGIMDTSGDITGLAQWLGRPPPAGPPGGEGAEPGT